MKLCTYAYTVFTEVVLNLRQHSECSSGARAGRKNWLFASQSQRDSAARAAALMTSCSRLVGKVELPPFSSVAAEYSVQFQQTFHEDARYSLQSTAAASGSLRTV